MRTQDHRAILIITLSESEDKLNTYTWLDATTTIIQFLSAKILQSKLQVKGNGVLYQLRFFLYHFTKCYYLRSRATYFVTRDNVFQYLTSRTLHSRLSITMITYFPLIMFCSILNGGMIRGRLKSSILVDCNSFRWKFNHGKKIKYLRKSY